MMTPTKKTSPLSHLQDSSPITLTIPSFTASMLGTPYIAPTKGTGPIKGLLWLPLSNTLLITLRWRGVLGREPKLTCALFRWIGESILTFTWPPTSGGTWSRGMRRSLPSMWCLCRLTTPSTMGKLTATRDWATSRIPWRGWWRMPRGWVWKSWKSLWPSKASWTSVQRG